MYAVVQAVIWIGIYDLRVKLSASEVRVVQNLLFDNCIGNARLISLSINCFIISTLYDQTKYSTERCHLDVLLHLK